ncbi:MAG: hypothetical protein HC813_01300 [Planctomycetes bacterium]|nr:hypothetical protein [Planctomycetota bacterium]
MAEKALEPTVQRRGSIYEVPVRTRIDLAPGANRLVFEFRIAGRLTSRTFLFHSGVAK